MKGAVHSVPGFHRRKSGHAPIPTSMKVADVALLEWQDRCLRCERIIQLTLNGWVHK